MAKQKIFLLYTLLLIIIPMVRALRSITPGQSIHYNETLVSSSGTFEAGFFSIGNSQNNYFCIWYKNLTPRTIVWVANRDTPVDNSTAIMFKVTDAGNPVIVDASGAIIWSSNASTTAQNPVMLLQDTGNLVVENGVNGSIVWQSFDYPGDTLLPGMVLHGDRVSGEHNSLTSWINTGDPGRGDFSYHFDCRGYPQLVITKGTRLIDRLGSWNGFFFSGVPWETLDDYFSFSFELTEEEVSFKYETLDDSIVSRYMINPTGTVQHFMWSSEAETWQLFQAGPRDQCDNYAFCGANSECSVHSSPICECLPGFTPKAPEKWSVSNWTDGCVRKVNLDCDERNGFVKPTGLLRPDTSSSWFDKNMDRQECQNQCLKNCSCIAYASLDIRNDGIGCIIWFNNIVDMRTESSIGQEIFLKLPASELGNSTDNAKKKKLVGILAGIGILIVITILGYVIYLKRKKLWKSGRDQKIDQEIHSDKYENVEKESNDLPTFDFSTIIDATDHFSSNNILGEGGYGPVYKGVLRNGREIAVKRLSLKSGQGPNEFKNEILLIANLQHRNLVKLLGCCIENDERILIYEYMPNRSLDNFIFGMSFFPI
ncbi:hypothetical protein Fmac_021264 [Flemingia macrophylla]|uniref:non-specific serine/threonine protein kinase n=1 Tax=Flemingia macrophylla TaxID=520843 RepID=A0ABD1LWC2_9FABA